MLTWVILKLSLIRKLQFHLHSSMAQYKESLTVCATDKGPGRGKVALSCSKC